MLFYEAKKTNIAFYTFIDIGAGKGEACFYAHLKMPTLNIIGVEFDNSLVEIANKNKLRFNDRLIAFVAADATEYLLPKQTCLIYMYNPFDNLVLETFLTNNIQSFIEFNSIIAYTNDTQRIVLMRFGFETIYRNQSTCNSLYQLAKWSKSTRHIFSANNTTFALLDSKH